MSTQAAGSPGADAAGKADDLWAVVLAAGLGTRMRSSVIKVLHRLCGRPMLEYPLSLLAPLGVSRSVLVLGHQAQEVEAELRKRGTFPTGGTVAIQAEPRGTADAVRCALPALPEGSGRVLILYGDTPLLTAERLKQLIDAAAGRPLALIGTTLEDPRGYGRLIRDTSGRVQRIVEEKDCGPEERRVREVNAGIYVVEQAFLRRALLRVRPSNAQREFYLTDLVAEAAAEGTEVAVIDAPPEEVLGVNDRVDLGTAEGLLRRRFNAQHQRNGVTLRDPATTYIDGDVTIERDTELGPGVHLRGRCRIGSGCTIDAGCVLTDVEVADAVHVKPYTVAGQSRIGARAQLGPFSHLRPGAELAEEAHVGNFVELKQTRLGRGSKANHLAYLGDSEIGAGVNVGCGTITCNYDGFKKHRTVIEDGVFIGSDTQLVAPVRVGKGAILAAGTTVTRDVPAGSLTLSRVPQIDKPGYADTLRERLRGSQGPSSSGSGSDKPR
jgi:bifunctional UDP-N-acetylglucosamine pyrophosphorylase/glucosamine-1-phosphate N-acetyltransferase